MSYQFPVVPCPHFEVGVGCSYWCSKEMDCCVLCCKRHECAKNGELCLKAQEILKIKKFKGKIYPWEIQSEEERKEWFNNEGEED